MHSQRETIQANSSFQRESSSLTISSEEEGREDIFPEFHATRRLESKILQLFQVLYFFLQNALPFRATYTSYYNLHIALFAVQA